MRQTTLKYIRGSVEGSVVITESCDPEDYKWQINRMRKELVDKGNTITASCERHTDERRASDDYGIVS